MTELVSKIPKEKLKVGKLYKTISKIQSNYEPPRYRVWLGDFFSGGSAFPEKENYPMYKEAIGVFYDTVYVVNSRATPFKPGVWINASHPDFLNAIKKASKPIRYLNRV